MARIAAVLMVKNEAERLPRALASVAWCDEIVVVDDESTDDTAAVAAAHGATVVPRKLDRYDDQRNAGAAAATADWILALDADEEVTPELADEIQALIDRPDALDVYGIPFRQCLFGAWPRYGGWADPLTRLHRREVRWQGAVHEQLPKPPGRYGVLRGHIVHHSHETLAGFLDKLNRYTDAEAAARHAAGQPVSVAKMILSPLRDFWRRYVLQQGFRDGVVGLILALLMAFTIFVVRAKAWELGRGRR